MSPNLIAILFLLVGSGVSGYLFHDLLDSVINIAEIDADPAHYDSDRSVADFESTTKESAKSVVRDHLTKDQLKELVRICSAVTVLFDRIDKLPDYITAHVDGTGEGFNNYLQTIINAENRFTTLTDNMRNIKQKYDSFQYMIMMTMLRNSTARIEETIPELLQLTEYTVSFANAGGIHELIGDLYMDVNPYGMTKLYKNGIFRYMAEMILAKNLSFCGNQSAQQQLYEAYKAISVLAVQGFVLLKYSYELLSILTNLTYVGERIKLAEDFIEKRHGYVSALREGLMMVNRYQRACSPKYLEPDKNYIELKGLYGPYILNEQDIDLEYRLEYILQQKKAARQISVLSGDSIWLHHFYIPLRQREDPSLGCGLKDCAILSSHYEAMRKKGNQTGENSSTNKERLQCRGEISGCVSMGKTAAFCRHSDRGISYGSIKTDKETYGREENCESQGKSDTKKWISAGPSKCLHCLCQCHSSDDNASDVVKWINTNDHIADIQHNMVITGITFEKNGNKIELKIKQGEVMAHGEVPKSKWTSGFQGNAEYLEIGEAHSKSLVLTHYEAEKGFAMTGLRFKRYFDKYVGIQIHCTKFDYESGKLNASQSYWRDIIKPDNIGKELKVDNSDSLFKYYTDYLNSANGQYVTFTTSDLGKSAGAYVVPFIDSVPVETVPGFVLNGAGLIHKGRNAYGGFVSFRLSTYDILEHIHTPK